MDIPLFVIAIVYGLLWKKATWQGAMAGYLAGAVAGATLRFGLHFDIAPVTLISGGVALLVCPHVSLISQGTGADLRLLIKNEVQPLPCGTQDRSSQSRTSERSG
jgi:Na+/proline symporter